MLSFHRAVEKEFAAVNQLIVDQLQSDVGLVENIGQYIVESGGKRLRPVVVLLSALANSYDGDKHIKLAAVIEFIHTATLLHDDVVDVSTLDVAAKLLMLSGAMRPACWWGTLFIPELFRYWWKLVIWPLWVLWLTPLM